MMRHGKHTARITNEEERKARLLSAWRNFPNSMPFGAICLLALFFISLPFLTGLLPIVRFTQEQIDVQVGTDLVQVTGFYRYRNPVPLPITQGLSVPLPASDKESTPINVSVTQLYPTQKPIPLRFLLGRYRCNLVFAAGEEIVLRVTYEQYAPARQARYILTTTQPWRRPLHYGLYRLFPQKVAITESNYPLKALSLGVVGFQRNDFMPPNDWQFAWEVLPQ